ncbi:MAG: PD40 domain-containing protein [Bacteroidales bacterium]|nr:PD40 domain-containing protein [Bacteroidales bacterium]
MRKEFFLIVFSFLLFTCQPGLKQDKRNDRISIDTDAGLKGLVITYPSDKSLFPPDITSPVFRWKDNTKRADLWIIIIELPNGDTIKAERATKSWKPDDDEWEFIKTQTTGRTATVNLYGVNKKKPGKQLSGYQITISTSEDEVGDCIFYREVTLPFIEAVKDPSKIRWRYGSISSEEQPPVVLEKLPVCGNCHSFSRNGNILGMDIDYANDKGSYAMVDVKEEINLNLKSIISWSNYRKEDKTLTFGLLSQVSPDGNYAVSTVKDRSVFVPVDNLEFSQLFFPIKGILTVYSRSDKKFRSLPGADDPNFVQSSPSWSPDGKYIMFARSKVYENKDLGNRSTVLLSPEECSDFINRNQLFLYDLYRVPFNNGKGGKPEPIKGASENGKSNYFAKYSPDGKWIVFCQASSFMLLQPDSKLFIIPAEGGDARMLKYNTDRMNSWHSWSSNSRWIVFSSKANGPYTQLFITHIDENGNDSPPILLENFTSSDMAANIPEFVSKKAGAIRRINEAFIDKISTDRIGLDYKALLDWEGIQLIKLGKYKEAEKKYKDILEVEPLDLKANYHLGVVLAYQKQFSEAEIQFNKIIASHPNHALSYEMIGMIKFEHGESDMAIKNLKYALQLNPNLEMARKTLEELEKKP